MTIYRYTGQRIETGTGLYDYGARWYDPAIGRFLAADSIVPNAGDSQALNRYMYVLGNPLKFSDPSGHDGCAANDRACWENEWYWKNRWYNAHGYFRDGDHWGLQGDAVFSDEGILREVLAEAGIATIGHWDFGQLSLIGQGVVALYQAIGSMSRLNDLLGPVPAFIERQSVGSGHCSTMSACTFGVLIQFYDGLFDQNADYIRGTAVHELAHVIDFWGRVTVPGASGRTNTLFPSFLFPQGTHITDYAMTGRLEYWAEAVTDWVYGERYKGPYNPNSATNPRSPLSVNQAAWIERFLKGWGW